MYRSRPSMTASETLNPFPDPISAPPAGREVRTASGFFSHRQLPDMSQPVLPDQDGDLRQPANKPGTSCLCCRRRKLKCTREPEGCQNCKKSELPCVYPAPEVGVKRKRGPYKKDRPARERHMEDVVKYLEPRNVGQDLSSQAETGSSDHLSPSSGTGLTGVPSFTRYQNGRSSAPGQRSEDLVKDALIALTGSSAPDQEPRAEDDNFLARNRPLGPVSETAAKHPPIRQVFEYWQIFVTRVEPMTKLIHCPTFGKRLCSIINDLNRIPTSTETLLFSVYYAAVSTCTVRECQRRFHESREVLLKRFSRGVKAAFEDDYAVPALETVQALVLYLVSHRYESILELELSATGLPTEA